nr:hypothetical protein [Tanacetum cinerariifolium]
GIKGTGTWGVGRDVWNCSGDVRVYGVVWGRRYTVRVFRREKQLELSTSKPAQDLSHINRPTAPIIEDWVSDSEDESKTKAPQIVPSFVQSSEQVKTYRHYVQPLETSIPVAPPKPTSPKSNSSVKRRNRKNCVVCKSVDHLIKDCDYHAKKKAQPTHKNYAHRVLTQSKPVFNTAVRPVCAAVPKIMGNPQYALKDKRVIDSGCSWHMTGNMSYLSEFKELNGGYVAFRGNPKGGKIFGKGKIKTDYKEIDGGYVAFGGNPKGGKITGRCTIKIASKDETIAILKTFITGREYIVDHKVKVIRYDNETEFKNREMNQFCETKGKFDDKVNEGFFVGYSLNSKAFRVFNNKTWIVKENLHIRFSENTPNIARSGLNWLFDIDALTKSMNYKPVVAGNQSNGNAGTQACDDAGKARLEIVLGKDYILIPLWTTGLFISQESKSSQDDVFQPSSDDEKKVDEDPRQECECKDQEQEDNVNNTNNVNAAGTNRVNDVGANLNNERLFDPEMPTLKDISTFNFLSDHKDDDEEAGMNNLDTTIQVSPTPTTRIHKDHPIDQVIGDLHSTTQTRHMSKNLKEHGFVTTIHERTNHKDLQNSLFACFLSQEEPKRGKIDKTLFIRRHKDEILLVQVYVNDIIFGLQVKQKQDGIFINQDEYVAKILKIYRFLEVKNASTPMKTQKPLLKDEDGEEVEVHMYRSMIGSLMYLTSLRPDIMFVVCGCARYQVNLKVSHLHVVKRIFRYLKGYSKLGLWYPKDSPFDLVAYTDSDYVRASLDRKSTTGGCQYLRCILVSWQCKKQIVVANSTTEAKYVAALRLQVKQKQDGIFINQDEYVAKILKIYGFLEVKNASTPMKTQKPMLKDEDREEVEVHMYRSMIGSLMYLTSLRPDIMFVVCGCARYQVNLKVSHLYVVKRIFSARNRLWLQIPQQKLNMWLLQVVVDKYSGFKINYLIMGKFDGKVNEGFFVVYSLNSKAFRVFNNKTWIVKENLHIRFSENTPNISRSGLNWLFNIDALTKSMNYKPVVAGNQSNGNAGTQACDDAGKARLEIVLGKDYIMIPLWTTGLFISQESKSSQDDVFQPSTDDEKKVDEDPRQESECKDQEQEDNVNNTNNVNAAGTNRVNDVGANLNNERLFDPKMHALKDISTFNFLSDHEDDDEEAGMNNLDTTIQVSPTPTTRIHKDHPIDQMNVKSAFLYGKIEKEVYVFQPSGFKDPNFPNKVYKIEKALYGLHQAPRAWYETLSTYLLDNGFHRGKIDKTLFIRRHKDEILLVQVYVNDIIFGLQVKQKQDGIFINQDEYVAKILKIYGFLEVKNASTPMKTQKPMLKDEDREEVEVHMYRSMIGSLMYLTSLRPDIMFVVCGCARYQVNLKVSHLYVVKRIFRYLKGYSKLGLWYPKDSPFDLVAYIDSDYVIASLDRKYTIGGCQYLRCILVSWQCKK